MYLVTICTAFEDLKSKLMLAIEMHVSENLEGFNYLFEAI